MKAGQLVDQLVDEKVALKAACWVVLTDSIEAGKSAELWGGNGVQNWESRLAVMTAGYLGKQ